MPLAMSCPTCHTPFSVQEELAGRKIRCTGCSTILVVPQQQATPPPRPASNSSGGLSASGIRSDKPVKKKKKKSVKTETPSKTALYLVIGGGITLFLAVIVLAVMFIPFGSMFSSKELEVVDVYTAINGMGYHTTGERLMQSKTTALSIPGRRKIIIARTSPQGNHLMMKLKIPYTDVEKFFPGSYAASRPFLTRGTIRLDCEGESLSPYFHHEENEAANGFQLDYSPRGDNPRPLEDYLGPSKDFDWTCDGDLEEGQDGMIFRGKRGLIAKIRLGSERQDGREGGNPLNKLTGRRIFQDRDGLVAGPGGYIHVSWNLETGGYIVSDELEMPNEIGRYWNVTCFFPRPKARGKEATLVVLNKPKTIKLP